MNGQQIGYVRVSTADQNTARQLEGVELDQVFEEKASAKDAARPQLQECMKYLRQGDTLHVHSIDRLARNLMDLQRIVEELAGRGVSVRFHKESLTFAGGENAMQKLMLQMMGAFAEFERSLIRERQREGIQAAKRRGKQIGAKKKLTLAQVAEIKARLERCESKAALAREYGVSRQTLYNAVAAA